MSTKTIYDLEEAIGEIGGYSEFGYFLEEYVWILQDPSKNEAEWEDYLASPYSKEKGGLIAETRASYGALEPFADDLELADSFGGEGDGAVIGKVFSFKGDLYRYEGYYSSWDSDDFDGAQLERVIAKEITTIIYVPFKD